MSTEKHTAGPWHFNLQPAPRHGTMVALVANSENELFRGINAGRSIKKEEMNANARLISAAPDLLAACQWAREAFVRAFGYESEQVKGMDKVIANATGGQP